MNIANAVGASLITAVAELEGSGGGATIWVQLTTTQPAVVPASPSSPNTPLNLALGLLVSLAVGVGPAVLRETLDTTVRGEQDVAHFGVPLLQQALDGVDQLADGLARSEALLGVLPEMFGADRPRSYLVVFQDSSELRPTGGIPGAWCCWRSAAVAPPCRGSGPVPT